MNKTEKEQLVVAAVLFVMVGLAGLWLGRQMITLSDLSQQRARQIAVAIFEECRKNFGKDVNEDAWLIMSARCHNIADKGKALIYAAGIEAEDRVLERAKQMVREMKAVK